MRLFLEALADKEDVNIDGNPVLTKIDNSFNMQLMRFLSNALIIIKTPSVICSQMQKQIDINKIHPSKLSGNKASSVLNLWKIHSIIGLFMLIITEN